MDHLDYLSGDASLPEEVPVTRYPDSGRRRQEGRHRDTGRPDYAPARLNSTPTRQLVNGRYPAEYPPNGRPARGYLPDNSGPMPAYPPPHGSSASGHPLSDGKRILGWLPFGQRLVLLPKDTPFGDGDEELREHRDVSGGWLRPAVFGAMDGLVTNSSLIAGIGGGGGSRAAIVLSGIAGLIAGAFSMATGEYIS